MSQWVESRTRTLTNGATARGANLRVKIASGVLALAGAADEDVGTTAARIEADVPGAVVLRSATGSVLMVAADEIAAGAAVYGGANGQVSASDAASAVLVGTALTASGAAGDWIEVVRH